MENLRLQSEIALLRSKQKQRPTKMTTPSVTYADIGGACTTVPRAGNLPCLWTKMLLSFLEKSPGKWRTWQQVSRLKICTWNVAGLSGTKELHLSCLLDRQTSTRP
ncbi:Hypothetical protein FKW44_023302 [Caligus rogercresseyi]|uniref:Uncharacterized protein n=1 Tax=Caligus rogercresseyi TaxID=217165 RepID=A0A7T8JUM3_CALRO|nr:Hypothetical protein FKW44_023302 [Caligus rogercresseyi]